MAKTFFSCGEDSQAMWLDGFTAGKNKNFKCPYETESIEAFYWIIGNRDSKDPRFNRGK